MRGNIQITSYWKSCTLQVTNFTLSEEDVGVFGKHVHAWRCLYLGCNKMPNKGCSWALRHVLVQGMVMNFIRCFDDWGLGFLIIIFRLKGNYQKQRPELQRLTNTNQAQQHQEAIHSSFPKNEKWHKGTPSHGIENSLCNSYSWPTWISWAHATDFQLPSAMHFSDWPSHSKFSICLLLTYWAPPSAPSEHPSHATEGS